MIYPTLKEQSVSRAFTDAFRGLNTGERPAENEWAWMQNASCDKYPVAATRARRRLDVCPASPRAFALIKSNREGVDAVSIGYDSQSGKKQLYVNGELPASGARTNYDTNYEKHIVVLGDRVYVLRSDKNDSDRPKQTESSFTLAFSNIDYTFDTNDFAEGVRFYPTDIDGNDMIVWYGYPRPNPPAEPEEPADTAGLYWIDTGGDSEQLCKYSYVLRDWIPVGRAYIKVEYRDNLTGAFDALKEGDAVVIDGAAAGYGIGPDSEPLRQEYNRRVISELNTAGNAGAIIVKTGGGDGVTYPYFIIEVSQVPATNARGYIGQDSAARMKITREVPAFEHVCAGENRVWGCDSGTNEIRACKMGDPSNWNMYAGISTDSYAVTVGGERGAFTGAAFASGSPIFFKENAVIKIYGTAPSNYRLSSITAPGVAPESAKSVAVINDRVFYLSPSGVCYYDGAAVHEIGQPLGKRGYKNGVGAGAANKYYLSCEDERGAHHLFVFDLTTGLWAREDDMHALYADSMGDFVSFVAQTGASDADVTMVTNKTDANLAEQGGAAFAAEEAFDWEYVTPIIGYESADEKYISRFNIRLSMNVGGRLDVYVKYDSGDAWKHKTSMTAYGRRSFTLPIRPRRCDHMQIRFAGHGDCMIYSFAKIYERGSDVVR